MSERRDGQKMGFGLRHGAGVSLHRGGCHLPTTLPGLPSTSMIPARA